MSVALDIGAARLKSLRHEGGRLVGRTCRGDCVVLENGESQRTLLNHMRAPHAICEEAIVVFGAHAADFSRLFHSPCRPLLAEGRVPAKDPAARQILAALVDALLPAPRQAGELCCLSYPGAPGAETPEGDADYEFYSRLLRPRGYEPVVLNAGMGAILAEMVESAFTGIGIDFGAATTEASAAHLGREIACCSIPRGGHWIDEQFALRNEEYNWNPQGERYLDLQGVAGWKESLSAPPGESADGREKLLAEICRELIAQVLNEIAAQFTDAGVSREIPQPVSVVVSGGTARLPGFEELLRSALRRFPLPVEVGNLRTAAGGDYTVARGGLIYAELERQAQRVQAAA